MKTNTPTNRRSFLSTLAVLTAGAAFGSAIDFLSPMYAKGDLLAQWKAFCKQNSGRSSIQNIQVDEAYMLQPFKGHIYEKGTTTYFETEGMMAQPTWIYWGCKKSSPDDVVITFTKGSGHTKQTFRLNRYEMEALQSLNSERISVSETRVLEDVAFARKNKKSSKDFYIKTKVEHRTAKIEVKHFEKRMTINKNGLYNI